MGAATLVAALLVLPASYVALATAGARHDDPGPVPDKPVALIFGAGLDADGKPSGMLADRLDAAIALYRRHKVRHLLLSGDNGSAYYNEVAAMQRYTLSHGVPAGAVTLDYAGFNTYASCYRARAIFGVRAATLVTQRYHLPRAVYVCRKLGIDADGLGTPDWGRVPTGMMNRFEIRELLATLRALWDVNVSHPKPKYLGKYEGLR